MNTLRNCAYKKSSFSLFILLAVISLLFGGCMSKSGFGSKSAQKVKSQFRKYLKNEEISRPGVKKEWMAFVDDEQKNAGNISAGVEKYKNNQRHALSEFKKEYNTYINNE